MRVGIVGASTLLGRELADVMSESALAAADVVLLDEEEATGRITVVGDEPSVIQRIEPAAFVGMELCFFAAGTATYWKMARDAGAGAVDLTNTLRGESGVALGLPWLDGLGAIGLATVAVVPADGAAVMLSLVAARCLRLGLKSVAATVMIPASERGQAGLDEMQRQVVSLLSFQPLPKEEFDAQVAFNLLPSLGEAAKVTLESTSSRIRTDYAAGRHGGLPELALQMVHAPVFHGYAMSMLLQFGESVNEETVRRALADGGQITLATEGEEPPSTLSAAGQGTVMAQVRADSGSHVWVWMTADNVRLAALHAIACGLEMQRLRPHGKIL